MSESLPQDRELIRDRLRQRLFDVFPDHGLGEGVSIDESHVIDMYGSDEERQVAKQNDPTSSLTWREMINHPYLSGGIGGFCFMDDVGKAFYFPACFATLLNQEVPDCGLCYTLAFQFEHSDTGVFRDCRYLIVEKGDS